jgi:hypothetical protein
LVVVVADLRPEVVLAADLAVAAEVKLLVPEQALPVKVTLEEMEPTQVATEAVAEVVQEPQVVRVVQVQLVVMAATVQLG